MCTWPHTGHPAGLHDVHMALYRPSCRPARAGCAHGRIQCLRIIFPDPDLLYGYGDTGPSLSHCIGCCASPSHSIGCCASPSHCIDAGRATGLVLLSRATCLVLLSRALCTPRLAILLWRRMAWMAQPHAAASIGYLGNRGGAPYTIIQPASYASGCSVMHTLICYIKGGRDHRTVCRISHTTYCATFKTHTHSD